MVGEFYKENWNKPNLVLHMDVFHYAPHAHELSR